MPKPFLRQSHSPRIAVISTLTRKVMSPERADLFLSAYVPYVELDVSEGNRLYVETDGGYSSDVLIKLDFV